MQAKAWENSRRNRWKCRKIWQANAWFYLLAEIAEKNVPRITGITRIRQAKAWLEDGHEWDDLGTFFFHMNYHELSVNGWRGFWCLAENAENADFTIPFQ